MYAAGRKVLMVNWFKQMAFWKKLLATYILFIGISCILFLAVCFRNMEAAKQEKYGYLNQFGKQVSLNIDNMAPNMERIRFIHFVDLNVKPIIRKCMEEKSNSQQFADSNYMKNTLLHMINMNQYVLRATLVTECGDIYSSFTTGQQEYSDQMEGLASQQEWDDRHKIYYTDVYRGEVGGIDFRLVTSISKMYDIDTPDPIGTVYVDLNFDAIEKTFDQTFTGGKKDGSFLIMGKNGEAFYHSPNIQSDDYNTIVAENQAAIHERIRDGSIYGVGKPVYLTLGGETCIVSAVLNEMTGWTIVQFIPLSLVYEESLQSMFGFLAGMGGVLVIAVILGFLMAKQISRPVRILSKAMAGATVGKVELIEMTGRERHDEMGQLMSNYNEMGRRINDSIEKIYIYQLNQKQTELKMLQFQISPHFLYNTLNTISSIAELNDMEEIEMISDSLSEMFRYNITGSDLVPVDEELNHVRNYMNIQAVRFPEQYRFNYELEPGIEKERMLKFLLQPLVENSMHHAFENHDGIREITLSVMRSGEKDIMISVRDNGCGIEPEKLMRLNRELEVTDTRTLVTNVDKGIGLRNVNARVKNYYGLEYGLQMESRLGEFTDIRIRIRRLMCQDSGSETGGRLCCKS